MVTAPLAGVCIANVSAVVNGFAVFRHFGNFEKDYFFTIEIDEMTFRREGDIEFFTP